MISPACDADFGSRLDALERKDPKSIGELISIAENEPEAAEALRGELQQRNERKASRVAGLGDHWNRRVRKVHPWSMNSCVGF